MNGNAAAQAPPRRSRPTGGATWRARRSRTSSSTSRGGADANVENSRPRAPRMAPLSSDRGRAWLCALESASLPLPEGPLLQPCGRAASLRASAARCPCVACSLLSCHPPRRRIPAHRVVLAARCEYFATMFSSGMRETRQATITIDDVSSVVFMALLVRRRCRLLISRLTPSHLLSSLAPQWLEPPSRLWSIAAPTRRACRWTGRPPSHPHPCPSRRDTNDRRSTSTATRRRSSRSSPYRSSLPPTASASSGSSSSAPRRSRPTSAAPT